MSSAEQTSPDGLQAGPELDRAVAEACGWPVDPEWFCDDCKRDGGGFHPSTDWNDAMLAVSKVDAEHNFALSTTDGPDDYQGWTAWFDEDSRGFADTGPLAICKSILALKR